MKEIKLNVTKRTVHYDKGYASIVDDEDFELVSAYLWQAKVHGQTVYARGIIDANANKSAYMHRLIMGISDPRIKIDHKDGNGLNNSRGNLRIATHSQNMKNRKLNQKKETKYKGVTKCKGGYYARITVDRKVISLGRFTTQEHAANTYNKSAIFNFGEYALLNKLPDDFDCNSIDVKNTRAKINFEIAQEIRISELSISEMSLKYGIHKSTIEDVLKGRSWIKPLPEQLYSTLPPNQRIK